MDRPAEDQLTLDLVRLRADASAITTAGIAGVSPHVLVPAALAGVAADVGGDGRPVTVVAAGKAAAAMHAAFVIARPGAVHASIAIGPHQPPGWTGPGWVTGGHPFATDGSVEGGRQALALAASVPADGHLVLLLSGGASALMAAPGFGLSLEDKQLAVRTMMRAGAAITELNAVRKHLSAVKGGRLAAACPGRLLTLAISDVVGDDLSVIGSGPGVPDPFTWQDAQAALDAFGGDGHPATVRARVAAGCAGDLPETPKSGDAVMQRARAHVIGGRRQAMAAAAAAAESLGYQAVILDPPVVGEARHAVAPWWATVRPLTTASGRRAIITSGETTVRVIGTGRGGRNQEFALAAAPLLAAQPQLTVLASAGTDGIDGPTDAAGAIVDGATLSRAAALGLDAVEVWLDRNDSYVFFSRLGDLLQPGPTDTNVGDLQVLLVSSH